MVLDRSSAQKFASLSALGISALAIGGQKAEASIIYSGPIDVKVGFDGAYSPSTSYNQPLAGGAAFQFTKFTVVSGAPGAHHKMSAGGTNIKWAVSSGLLQVFAAGATWAARSASVPKAVMGAVTAGGAAGLPNTTSKYALFEFTAAAQNFFGWVEFSFHKANGVGPDLDVLGYAYDDAAGTVIHAGATSSAAPTPEPATFALTGLAMMSLGALGVRRYRKARQTANIEA